MKQRKKFTIVLSIALILLIIIPVGISLAQRTRSLEGIDAAAEFGTAITYQGKLEDKNGPIDGIRDFALHSFRLRQWN